VVRWLAWMSHTLVVMNLDLIWHLYIVQLDRVLIIDPRTVLRYLADLVSVTELTLAGNESYLG